MQKFIIKNKIQNHDQRDNLGVTVGFSTTNKLGSKIIRMVTRSKVSHAWLSFFDETLQQRMVIQAEIWGYEIRPWNRWLSENQWVSEYVLPKSEHSKEALQYTASLLGCDYDFESVFIIGLKRWFNRIRRVPWKSPKKLMCSEGVIRYLQKAKYQFVEHLDPELTSPQILLETMDYFKLEKLLNPIK